MQEARMFLATRERDGDEKLLPAHQVVIRDWENHDFGRNVFLAPRDDKDSTLESGCTSSGARYHSTHSLS